MIGPIWSCFGVTLGKKYEVIIYSDSMFCGTVGSCHSDSGGPLVVPNQNNPYQTTYQLAGIGKAIFNSESHCHELQIARSIMFLTVKIVTGFQKKV